MSTVRYFRWDDAGAPSLTGEVGSLTSLLRKCLVGTSGIAYGSKPSAGWTELFAGAASNVAVFVNRFADGGSECCVRVDDNAPGAAGAREAAITTFSTMTDINTGLDALPQQWCRKSATANSSARKWLVIADGLTAWVYVFATGDVGPEYAWDTSLLGIGDYAPFAATNYRYFQFGRLYQNREYGGDQPAFRYGHAAGGISAMPVTGVGAVLDLCVSPPTNRNDTVVFGGANAMPNPDPRSGKTLFISNPLLQVAPQSSEVYGWLRGIYLPLNNLTAGHQTTRGTAIGGDASKILAIFAGGGYQSGLSDAACIALDSVGPWA